MITNKPVLYFLSGPTAVGKTELALAWAEKHGAEILNCDALLFYEGMDIGTAKPTQAERERVPHHGIDIVPVDCAYSIAQYVVYAREWVEDILQRGKKILITGGSGFYLKSFFTPVVDQTEVTDEVREEVRQLIETSLPDAVKKLRELNPEGLPKIDLQNSRRVASSLERCLASGKTLYQLHAEFEKLPKPYEAFEKRLVVLERDRDELNQRIHQRVEQMLEMGLIAEVKALLKRGLTNNPTAASAIGYREVIHYLQHDGTKTELIEEIATNTRRLVKKQRTWFRHQLSDVHNLTLPQADALAVLEAFFEK